MIRYKVFGFAIISFIVIWLVLLLGSDAGFPIEMYRTKNIDSLIVAMDGNIHSIQSQDTIEDIVNILSSSKKLTGIDRSNINKDTYRIVFYPSKSQSVFDIRILSNVYHGKIVAYMNSYYSGDSIDLYIKSIK